VPRLKKVRLWAILGALGAVAGLGIAYAWCEFIAPWLKRFRDNLGGGIRGISGIGGGVDAGADRARRQLGDNQESIRHGDEQLVRNSEQLRDNSIAVESAGEQLDRNSRASAALDAALERLRCARERSGG